MADSKEVIQARLLTNISDEYDKTEGSFFYDVEKPVAIELERAYQNQEGILDKGFVDTAADEYLDRKVSEQGIYRKQATKSTGQVVITGAVGAVINIGDRVASDTVNFIFTENKTIDGTGQATVNIECEYEGSIGNVPAGAIKYFPVTLEGLYTVTNINSINNGFDRENDEELRQRYYDKVRRPAASGNKYDYLYWATQILYVGNAKVFPLWNGPGTVKVVIIDNNMRAASDEIVNIVKDYIENERPIGANVTVISAKEKMINISISLVIDTKNYTLDMVRRTIEYDLTEYFKSISFMKTYVSYASIGNLIYDTPGVIDYSNLLVNNGIVNIPLGEEEIPILGGVTIG